MTKPVTVGDGAIIYMCVILLLAMLIIYFYMIKKYKCPKKSDFDDSDTRRNR